MRSVLVLFLFLFSFFSFAQSVSAHEAYVLTHNEFQKGLTIYSSNPLAPLMQKTYLPISITITIGVIILYILGILWSITPWATSFDMLIKKARFIGPLIIRFAIGSSFFYAAMSNSFLGPELQLSAFAEAQFVRIVLFTLSLMISFGFLTEIAAGVGLFLFIYASTLFHGYMITYLNYLGELIVLFLFGSRFISFDLLLFGKKAWNKSLEKMRDLETPIVRMLYGIALMYAGWTIKFAHQNLSIEVYNQYHLVNFFHAQAAFIAAGAGVSEILIGFFIFIGFQQRLTTLISLIFITLSILYFREMLWPHFMLYGISFSIIINSRDTFTIDRYLALFLKGILGIKQKSK